MLPVPRACFNNRTSQLNDSLAKTGSDWEFHFYSRPILRRTGASAGNC